MFVNGPSFESTLVFGHQGGRSMAAKGKVNLSAYFKNVDKRLAHLILDEIVDQGPSTSFGDIGESDRRSLDVLLSCYKKRNCNQYMFPYSTSLFREFLSDNACH